MYLSYLKKIIFRFSCQVNIKVSGGWGQLIKGKNERNNLKM